MGERRYHCVRFSLKKKYTEGDLRMEMGRLEFSRCVLQRALKFEPKDLNCLIALPNGMSWDVSFCNEGVYRAFWTRYEEKKDLPALVMFNVEALSDNSVKTVVVRMLNESVTDCDIRTWLCRYCDVKRAPVKVCDLDGVWNGAWRVLVRLASDPQGYGGFRHIPSDIMLGGSRGFVNYWGQPKYCRKCGELGHLAVLCTKVVCGICKEEGHVAAQCVKRKACNLCGDDKHLFRDCPLSFSNRLRKGTEVNADKEVEQNETNLVVDLNEGPSASREFFSNAEGGKEVIGTNEQVINKVEAEMRTGEKEENGSEADSGGEGCSTENQGLVVRGVRVSASDVNRLMEEMLEEMAAKNAAKALVREEEEDMDQDKLLEKRKMESEKNEGFFIKKKQSKKKQRVDLSEGQEGEGEGEVDDSSLSINIHSPMSPEIPPQLDANVNYSDDMFLDLTCVEDFVRTTNMVEAPK